MLAPLVIYIVLPVVGLLVFLGLIRVMQGSDMASPPVLAYFVLFLTLGGWAQVLLTGVYWEWSGLASIGVVYLLLIAPLVTAACAASIRFERSHSVFHRWAFWLNVSYTCVLYIGLAIAFWTKLIPA